jgi:8-oxo-dGTP diphosphatase
MSNNEHEKTKVSQSILIVRDNKILILQHKSGGWLLPGGRLNVKEKWLSGLLREIKEESSIKDVEIVNILEVDNWTHKNESHYGVFFHGVSASDVVRLSDEHQDFAWVSKEEIKDYKFWNEALQERIVRLVDKVLN